MSLILPEIFLPITAPAAPPTQPANASIPVAATGPGNYAANFFTGFTTPATTIGNGLGFDAISPNPDSNQLLATTTGQWRDMEVTTYILNGAIYLRMLNGSALYFTNLGGVVKIGIVEGFVPSNTDMGGTGTFYPYYINETPGSTLSGYSTASASRPFTFGCNGFNVYLKINGVTVFEYVEWRLMQYGSAALWTHQAAAPGEGTTDVTVNYLPLASLYSTTKNTSRAAMDVYDPRDFGMRAVTPTTGSISAGSNLLTLASNVGFQVGDQVIVAVGGEAGGGLRGTQGVGGVWPLLNYATVAAMNADTSQASATCAWVTANNTCYQWTGSVWNTPIDGQRYYPNEPIPLALIAMVTAVGGAGTVLSLSKNAATTTTNANVYLDSVPSFYMFTQAVINIVGGAGQGEVAPNPDNVRFSIPAGTWYFSGPVVGPGNNVGNFGDDWWIYGAGRTLTTLVSPPGCDATFFDLENLNSNGFVISDFKCVGNRGNNAGGWTLRMLTPNTDDGYPCFVILGSLFSGQPGFIVRNIDGHNGFNCVGLNSLGGLIENCTYLEDAVALDYFEWVFQLNTSTNATIKNCTFTNNTYGRQAFAMFECTNSSIINCGGTNCMYDVNSNHGFTLDLRGLTLNYTQDSYLSSYGIDQAIVSLNTNATGTGSGGTVYLGQMIQNGYTNTQANPIPPGDLNAGSYNNSRKFIQIAAQYSGTQIIGAYDPGVTTTLQMDGYLQAPNYDSNSAEYGAMAIYNDAPGCTINGIRIVGSAIGSPGHSAHFGNISTSSSSSTNAETVENCVADVIQQNQTTPPTVTNCVNNASYP